MKVQTCIPFIHLVLCTLFGAYNSVAQYDTIHFIPPLYSRNSDTGELGRSYLYLSTNRTDTFEVRVSKSDGSLITAVMISADSPAEILLGFQYGAIGIVDQSGLNTVIDSEGIIAKASFPFFANLRHKSAAQGMSLTCKGTAALGTRFRSGHLYTRISTTYDGPLKSHMISVMATEDNTTVTFSDFKPGVIFYGTATVGNTSETITVTLNKYESYIIAAHVDEPFSTGNELQVNGVLIESDRPIAVNTGSWCGGSNLVDGLPSRDIGMDQIVPIDLLGSEYVVVKRFSVLEEECERVCVIADYDNTLVYINGNSQPETVLNQGEYYFIPAARYDANDVMYIECSEKAYVYQSTNESPDISHAQGLNFIPPLRCTGLKEVSIPKLESFGGEPAGIDIIARSGSPVFVNDIALTLTPAAVTGNPDYEVYKLYNCTGTMHVRSERPIAVSMITCSGISGAAGYYSGFMPDPAGPELHAISFGSNNTVTEGCVKGGFVISRPLELSNEDFTYYFTLGGEAENGLDYAYVSSSIFLAAGQLTDTVWIFPLRDGVSEIGESIVLTLLNINCEGSTKESTLFIEKDQAIDFHLLGGNQCLPFAAEFINESDVAPGSTYLWDFGDGHTSTLANPTHTYQDEGYYQVSLTIFSANGCADTLFLDQQDLVNTHPTPQANFSLHPERTDICNSLVSFIDLSLGADKIRYDFDDGTPALDETAPSYLYGSEGIHRPMQIVESEYGCKDTAYREVYIEPFSVFAPNTFTPEGNTINEEFIPVASMEPQEWHLQIFNRWGELVFESRDVNHGWDGTLLTTERAPDGVYQWVLTFVSCEPLNPTQQVTGHVNLIR